jgi:drug/metabolite transporter (DMT)-like permease
VFLAGVYIYNFLDPRLKGAPLIHIILLMVLMFSFLIVIFFEKLIEWNMVIGSLFIILFTFSIIRIKQPEYAE